jgi:hypothetical protein
VETECGLWMHRETEVLRAAAAIEDEAEIAC